MISRAQVDKRVLHDTSSSHVCQQKLRYIKNLYHNYHNWSRRDESRLKDFPFLLLHSDGKFYALITYQNQFPSSLKQLRHVHLFSLWKYWTRDVNEKKLHLLSPLQFTFLAVQTAYRGWIYFIVFSFQSCCSKKSLAIPKWPRTKETFCIDRDNVLAWLPLISQKVDHFDSNEFTFYFIQILSFPVFDVACIISASINHLNIFRSTN